MNLTVRYFARIREHLGTGQSLHFPADAAAVPTTVGELRAWLAAQSPAHAQALAPHAGLRAAYNQDLCSMDQPLADGAEVAFFPPVTGG